MVKQLRNRIEDYLKYIAYDVSLLTEDHVGEKNEREHTAR